MANRNYWQKRMKALENQSYESAVQCYQDIQEEYRKAINNLQMDIMKWYQRLADNNDISYAAAKKFLKTSDLEEFKWTVEQYIKAGEENAIDQRWMKQLENASCKYHISYLEAMKLQAQQHAELLLSELENGMTEHLHKTYSDQFYRSAYEIAKGTGVGSNLAALGTDKIELVLQKPWARDGKNFSDRIWNNKEKLINNLHTDLTQSIIRGEDPQKAINQLARDMNVSRSQAGNLIMTETTAISAVAQKDCFKELDVEEFEVVETLDGSTCEICQDMDGKHFPMSDYRIGETAPPFHPRCRGCTCPYFDDEFTEGQRVARDEDGEVYYVPEDMTYKEWKETYVQDAEQLTAPKINDLKIQKAYDEFNQLLSDKDDNSMLLNNMIIYSDMTVFKRNDSCSVPFAYDVKQDAIVYNPQAPDYELYDLNYVQAHELAHRMDIKEYRSWTNADFKDSIEISKKKVYDNIKIVRDWFKEGGKYENDMALSDIISAITCGNENEYLFSGHSPEYWRNEKNRCLEIFANMCSIKINGYGSESALKTMFHELHDAFERMTK